MNMKISLTLILVALTALPVPLMAKEASQNFVVHETFKYFWNRWSTNPSINLGTEAQVVQSTGGWDRGLANPNVTIRYRANVINDATGASVTDGSTLAVGTVLRLEFDQHVPSDIYWFGTGFSMDSPYGEWREGAAPPALTSQNRGKGAGYLPTCEAKDYLNTVRPLGVELDIHIPFVVSPPTRSITTSSNLTCGAPDASGNKRCTVNATGPISVAFNFDPTYGKFYYRYYDERTVSGAPGWVANPGCYGNNVAMRPSNATYVAQAAQVCWTECVASTCVPPPEYFDYGNSGTYTGGGAYGPGGGGFTPIQNNEN